MTDDKCALEVEWAGGTHVFSLGHPWVQRVLTYRGLPSGVTPAGCFVQFGDASYKSEDVERIIELALIGGGMSENDAIALMEAHVYGKPLATNAMLASGILKAFILGAHQSDNEEIR